MKSISLHIQKHLYLIKFYVAIFIIAATYYVMFTQVSPIMLLETEVALNIADLISYTDFVLICASMGGVIALLIVLKNAVTVSLPHWFVAIIMCSAALLPMYPNDSSDFFVNFWYPERIIVYGENPYESDFDSRTEHYSKSNLPIVAPAPVLPYGPLWLLFQYTLYDAVRELPLVTMVFITKVVSIGFFLVAAWILLAIGKVQKQVPLAGALLLSPVSMVALAGNAHNDSLFLIPVFLSVYCMLKKNHATAFWLLFTSVWLKFITAALLPFVFVWWWKEKQTRQDRIFQIGSIILGGIISLLLTNHFNLLLAIYNQASLSGFTLLFGWTFSFPDTLWIRALKPAFSIFFIAYYIYLFKQLLSTPKEQLNEKLHTIMLLTLSASFVLVTQLWGYWYLTWILPLLMIIKDIPWKSFLVLSTLNLLGFIASLLVFRLNLINIHYHVLKIALLTTTSILTLSLLLLWRQFDNHAKKTLP